MIIYSIILYSEAVDTFDSYKTYNSFVISYFLIRGEVDWMDNNNMDYNNQDHNNQGQNSDQNNSGYDYLKSDYVKPPESTDAQYTGYAEPGPGGYSVYEDTKRAEGGAGYDREWEDPYRDDPYRRKTKTDKNGLAVGLVGGALVGIFTPFTFPFAVAAGAAIGLYYDHKKRKDDDSGRR